MAFGALAIAGGVLIAWMLTKDAPRQTVAEAPSQDPRKQSEKTTIQPVQKGPTGATTPDRSRVKAASAPFLGKIDNWAETLQQRSKGFGEAYQGLVTAHFEWHQGKVNAANARAQELTIAEIQAASAAADADKKIEQTRAALESAQAVQSPVSRFILSLQALEDLPTQIDEAKARWQKASADAEQAEELYRTAAAAVYDAEDYDQRRKAWEQAELLRKNVAAAASNRDAAERELEQKRALLVSTREDVSNAAGALPADGAEGSTLRAAWEEYVKSTTSVRTAESALETAEGTITSLASELVSAQSAFADKEGHYKTVHATLLKVSGAKADAESNYQRNGGDFNKRKIEELAKSESEWKETDKTAKNEMNEARKVVSDLTTEKKKYEREVPKLKEALVAAQKAADGASRKFSTAVAPARTRVLSDQAKQSAAIKKLQVDLEEARKARQASLDDSARLAQEQQKVQAELEWLDGLKDELEVWDRRVLTDPLPEEIRHLASRLDALKKLEYLTLPEVQGVISKAYALEEAIKNLQDVTDPPEFGNRLRNALGNPMDKWRATAGKTLALISEVRADAEALSLSLWGARND